MDFVFRPDCEQLVMKRALMELNVTQKVIFSYRLRESDGKLF